MRLTHMEHENFALDQSRFHILLSVHNTQMGAVLHALDSGAVLDLHANEKSTIQAKILASVTIENFDHTGSNRHRTNTHRASYCRRKISSSLHDTAYSNCYLFSRFVF